MKQKSLSKMAHGAIGLNEDLFRGIDFQKALRSFQKDYAGNLKFISGNAKTIVECLSNPMNQIYDDCKSFADVCQVVEDNCQGVLSGDSVNAIAATICDKKGINPDDSCYDSRMLANDNLKNMGITKDNAGSIKPDYAGCRLDDKSWRLFLLTHSRSIYRRYRKAMSEDKSE